METKGNLSNMKVSVVTISYNQGAYLERTIQSIISQSYKNLEYIIIDGGSTDHSVEVIKQYAHYLKYWVSEPDLGPANALNKGLAQAEGDIFYYLNSDDELLPNALETVVRCVEQNAHFDVFYGHGYVINEASRKTGLILSDGWNLNFYVQGEVSIVQPATFIRMNAYRQDRWFNEQNHTCWDGELLVHLSLQGAKFYRLSHLLCKFRVHPAAISSQTASQKQAYKLDCTRIFKFVEKSTDLRLYPRAWIKMLKLLNDPLVMLYRAYSKLKKVISL
jgi:glycosyltransferase involved in cell wall biosynthesis